MQNNKVKNSETTYFSTSPVQDQFGSIIVAFGIQKRERLAMELFIKRFERMPDPTLYIGECYKLADAFFNYEEKSQKENTPKIIL